MPRTPAAPNDRFIPAWPQPMRRLQRRLPCLLRPPTRSLRPSYAGNAPRTSWGFHPGFFVFVQFHYQGLRPPTAPPLAARPIFFSFPLLPAAGSPRRPLSSFWVWPVTPALLERKNFSPSSEGARAGQPAGGSSETQTYGQCTFPRGELRHTVRNRPYCPVPETNATKSGTIGFRTSRS